MHAPRKSRPFRPSALSLEAICPVSGFAAALPIVASAILTEAATSPTGAQLPLHSELTSTLSSPLQLNRAQIATNPSSWVLTAKPITDSPTLITLIVDQAAGSATGVDIGRYGNAITLASATLPSPQSTLPTPGQDAGGSGGIGAPTSTIAQSTDNAVTTPATVGPASSPNNVALRANLTPKIRPMTLAAASKNLSSPISDENADAMVANSSPGAQTSPNASSGSSPSSGSGSGSGSGSTSVLTQKFGS